MKVKKLKRSDKDIKISHNTDFLKDGISLKATWKIFDIPVMEQGPKNYQKVGSLY